MCATGNFYLSYVDPAVVGRRAFHSTNDFLGGVLEHLRDALGAVVDTVTDTTLDISKGLSSYLFTSDLYVFLFHTASNDIQFIFSSNCLVC